jgi:hypothetical protein
VTTEVLVVGAGAVGQVFALHLQRAGAKISFFVRPKHALPSRLPLFPQVKGRAALEGFARLTRPEEVAARRFDQVWLAVPSDSLGGAWVAELLAAIGDATVVVLAPEGDGGAPRERLVLGAIPFLAWQHPLPGEQGEPGLAFWIPPLARVPLSGPRARVDGVFALLKAGGLRPQRVADAAKTAAPVTALLMAMVAGLEAAGWTVRGFRGRWARVSAGGAREALRLADASPVWKLGGQGWLLATILWLGARVLPFDLEGYLRYHFTKVGAQTRVLLRGWLTHGAERKLPTSNLEQLLRAIE